METRLEIRPFPTQKQRKEIKSLPQVVSVETDGEKAFVVHSAWSEKEHIVVQALNSIGFGVVGHTILSGDEWVKSKLAAFKSKKHQKRKKNEDYLGFGI